MSKQLCQVVASRMNMQPALISPAHGAMLVENLRQLAAADADQEEAHQIKARNDLLAAYGYSPSSENKPFIYADGIAFIPVSGLLINRFNASYGWVTGYNFIRSWLNAALEDEDVKLIVFDCNSGGGEVAGCFELCADIKASRSIKPSVAVVDSSSYSACYAIASSAGRVIVTPSGGVGSIGVVAMHVDFSKMLTEAGITVTFISSGDHKVDGNPYQPLPAPVRKSIQARVDATRVEFVNLVASNRSLDTKVVFDTEAACYTAKDALDLGLIDAIVPPLEAVQAFLIELSGSQLSKESDMTTAEKAGADNATAENKDEGKQTPAPTVNVAAERTAERERIKAITTHEAAKGRENLANHLALNTDMAVEAATGILAAAPMEPKEEAAGGSSAFTDAMNTSQNPNVGADAGASEGEMSAAQRILAAQKLATGVTH